METAYVITIFTMFTFLFFIVGGIVGWLFYKNIKDNRPPYLHPEFFDQNGNIIPDEVVSVSFNPDYFLDEEDEDEDDD